MLGLTRLYRMARVSHMEQHTQPLTPKELDAEPLTDVLRFHLPKGLRGRFKLAAMKDGKTMSETLRDFIEQYTEESEQHIFVKRERL